MTTPHDEQLTPEAQVLIPRAREEQKISRRSPILTTMIAAALVIIMSGGVWAWASLTTSDAVQKEFGNNNARNITDLQEQMKGVCKKVSDPSKLTSEERDGCYRAENNLPPVTVTEQPQITISGLTADQAQRMIDSAVANLPKPLTLEQVTKTVTDIYAAHKPEDGKDATPEQVASAVILYCGSTLCQGPPGVEGKQGPPPTTEQVEAFVNSYCESHNQCKGDKGDKGETGVQGTGIALMEFRGNLTSCVLHVEYDKPTVMGEVSTDISVPGTLCTPQASLKLPVQSTGH